MCVSGEQLHVPVSALHVAQGPPNGLSRSRTRSARRLWGSGAGAGAASSAGTVLGGFGLFLLPGGRPRRFGWGSAGFRRLRHGLRSKLLCSRLCRRLLQQTLQRQEPRGVLRCQPFLLRILFYWSLLREPFPGRLERLGQGLLPALVDPQPGQMPGSLLMF